MFSAAPWKSQSAAQPGVRDGENEGLENMNKNQRNVTLNRKSGWKDSAPAPLYLCFFVKWRGDRGGGGIRKKFYW